MADKHTSLVFIVNGTEVALDHLGLSEPLRAARNKALAESKNTGRPPDDWQIKDAAGNQLDPDRRLDTLPPGTKLFLTLGVGAGG